MYGRRHSRLAPSFPRKRESTAPGVVDHAVGYGLRHSRLAPSFPRKRESTAPGVVDHAVGYGLRHSRPASSFPRKRESTAPCHANAALAGKVLDSRFRGNDGVGGNGGVDGNGEDGAPLFDVAAELAATPPTSFPRKRESTAPCLGNAVLAGKVLDSRIRGNDGASGNDIIVCAGRIRLRYPDSRIRGNDGAGGNDVDDSNRRRSRHRAESSGAEQAQGAGFGDVAAE